jgi:hypothetical protein
MAIYDLVNSHQVIRHCTHNVLWTPTKICLGLHKSITKSVHSRKAHSIVEQYATLFFLRKSTRYIALLLNGNAVVGVECGRFRIKTIVPSRGSRYVSVVDSASLLSELYGGVPGDAEQCLLAKSMRGPILHTLAEGERLRPHCLVGVCGYERGGDSGSSPSHYKCSWMYAQRLGRN